MSNEFSGIYKLAGVNDSNMFYQSMSPKFNREMIFKAGEGAGRSGSFFFFSHDSKFVVKTITSSELKLIKRNMVAYRKHLDKNPIQSRQTGLAQYTSC
jgi:hypothetical protein